ncbi:MAG: DotA/TraY family protein [Alphaproteobacteria bacterium]|nr:DotA/TraY family protein [Alphaproteobacteria bacterium]
MRLLPKGHPFFHTNQKYGVRHVLAEAARHLQFKWRNVDQLIVYAALVCGAALMFAFILAIIFYVIISTPAQAGLYIQDMFVTPVPDNDVAFMMMDRVLGIPGIFDSEVITNPALYGGTPTPMHIALHALFRFFSYGLFLLAIFIFLYFVVEIIFEVTQTGSPLGETLQNTWIPLRLVIAFGLLIPVSSGLNSAQYITLYVAKMGSGLATNAWGTFNMITGLNPTGFGNDQLIARVKGPDMSNLLKGLMVMKGCQQIHAYAWVASAYTAPGTNPDGRNGFFAVEPYIVSSGQGRVMFPSSSPVNTETSILDPVGGDYINNPVQVVEGNPGSAFSLAMNASGNAGIRLVMGFKNTDQPDLFKEYPGGVLPVCGEVFIPVSGYNAEGLLTAEAYLYAVLYVLRDQNRQGVTLDQYELDSGLATVREFTRNSSDYQAAMQVIRNLTNQPFQCLFDQNFDGFESVDENNGDGGVLMGECTKPVPYAYWNKYLGNAANVFAYHPPAVALAAIADVGNTVDKYSIGDARFSTLGLVDPMMTEAAFYELGWGGAGMWYNKITEKNGSYVAAVSSIPVIQKMPLVMEQIKEQRAKNNTYKDSSFCSQYKMNKSGTTSVVIKNEKTQFDAEAAENLYILCKNLFENQHISVDIFDSGGDMVFASNSTNYSNPIERAMAMAFGDFQVFDIIENQKLGVLPMAQLSATGKMLVDKSIMALMAALGSSATGGLLHMASLSSNGEDVEALNMLGDAFGGFAGAAMSFATLGLTTGVMLHYILPFLPFIYFFFAVGRWVKTIFEALVGVPLWALAHLRLSGQGLPGDAASSGYFLLLEIFIRPILTVFSLVASFAVFIAMVTVMNSVFELLITNFSGYNFVDLKNANDPVTLARITESMRGIADQFFYTVMYIVLTYMIATSSFKLIDIIPDNILTRWSGAGVSSMGASDNADDLIDQLQTQMPVIISHFTGKVGKGIKEVIYDPMKREGQKHMAEHMKAKKELGEAVLKYAEKNGNITQDQIARINEKYKLESDSVEAVMKQLVKSGKLERDGFGWSKKPLTSR